MTDQAFNTSGDYERFVIKDGVRYHHILDARTGFPARGCRSVTLLANDAFLADTLDTAIFAVGPETRHEDHRGAARSRGRDHRRRQQGPRSPRA